MPEKKFDVGDEPEEEQQAHAHQKTQSIRDRSATQPEELIYDAAERGGCYHCIRVLWCGCFEPYAHITTKYVKEQRWESCKKKTDSMAFENIKDVRRQQTCCCLMASFAPCCPCINDMGDLVLFGSDASEKKKDRTKGVQVAADYSDEKWVLKRISNSFETFERITGHLQDIHQDWRKVGRNLGRKIQQVKQ
mmetsp:Transcript_13324/g.11913  ORF Transcript_13324/g.11913 Transcript_13324/m.11913 type:complete len:192 (-) Transcript_13324:136-711(-)